MILFGVILFAIAGPWFGHRAWTNDAGIVINGLVPVPPTAATAFLAILGLLTTLMAMAGGATILNHILSPSRISLRIDHIVLPVGGLLRADRVITNAELERIVTTSVSGHDFAYVYLSDCTKVTITGSMLESAATFQLILADIASRIMNSHG